MCCSLRIRGGLEVWWIDPWSTRPGQNSWLGDPWRLTPDPILALPRSASDCGVRRLFVSIYHERVRIFVSVTTSVKLDYFLSHPNDKLSFFVYLCNTKVVARNNQSETLRSMTNMFNCKTRPIHTHFLLLQIDSKRLYRNGNQKRLRKASELEFAHKHKQTYLCRACIGLQLLRTRSAKEIILNYWCSYKSLFLSLGLSPRVGSGAL